MTRAAAAESACCVMPLSPALGPQSVPNNPWREVLLDRNALREVTWLVDVGPLEDRNVIGEQL
jgi:hypothetical protein